MTFLTDPADFEHAEQIAHELDIDDDAGQYDDEDNVSIDEVYNRAYSHFGNAELAHEAATMYPGDFM